jgi:hypothetical protein
MTNPIFTTGQAFNRPCFDVVGNCFISELHTGDRALPDLREPHEPGAIRALLTRLTGIVVFSKTH